MKTIKFFLKVMFWPAQAVAIEMVTEGLKERNAELQKY